MHATRTECLADRCNRPTETFLCTACTAEVVTALRELAFSTNRNGDRRPGLLADLQDTRLRRDKVASASVGSTGGRETPLPFHLAAAELVDVARNTISTWARDLAESNPHLVLDADGITEAAEWMSRYPSLIAMHPAAGELHDEITHLVAEIRRMIDRAPDRIYLGVCGHILDPQSAEHGTETIRCAERVFGAPEDTTVRCRACDTEHDAHKRWLSIQDRVRDSLATAAEISGAIAKLYGRQINVKTVRTWAMRGAIETHGTNSAGEPMHLVSEVLDRASRRGGLRKPA